MASKINSTPKILIPQKLFSQKNKVRNILEIHLTVNVLTVVINLSDLFLL